MSRSNPVPYADATSETPASETFSTSLRDKLAAQKKQIDDLAAAIDLAVADKDADIAPLEKLLNGGY